MFLVTTISTSLTGFSSSIATISCPRTSSASFRSSCSRDVFALYLRRLRGRWRRVYVIGAVISLYLNVFVLVVQSFLKVPALHALAPNAPANPEAPFKIAQGALILLFVIAGFLAVKRCRAADIPMQRAPIATR